MTVSRLQPYAITVFAEMSALAARIGAVNLGQGFPDEDGPPAMLKTAQNAIAEGVNQYPPGLGIAPLRSRMGASWPALHSSISPVRTSRIPAIAVTKRACGLSRATS